MKKNGFTLVELLAVIVILALLIVITANTVLPMLSKTKKRAMLVYAEKVLEKASSAYMVDSMTNGGNPESYSIQKLMGNDNYYGGVRVSTLNGEYVFDIAMFDSKEELGLKSIGLTSEVIKKDLDKIITSENYTEDDSPDKYDTDEKIEGYSFSKSEAEMSRNLFNLESKEVFTASTTTHIVENQTYTRKFINATFSSTSYLIPNNVLNHFSNTLTLQPGTYIWSLHVIENTSSNSVNNPYITLKENPEDELETGQKWYAGEFITLDRKLFITEFRMATMGFYEDEYVKVKIQIEKGKTVTEYQPYF